MPTNKNISQI